jgi:hypothetical protein
VEPPAPFAADALKDAAERHAGHLAPYDVPSPTFDVALITPALVYGVQARSVQSSRRARGAARTPDVPPELVRVLTDFGNWSEYVADAPPVVLVRVTPRLVEGFWTTVARGAAQTQGVKVPPIKRVKSPFSRLRAYCDNAEVIPIHSFVLEQRLPQGETVSEGLYAFAPDAFGPQCGTVKLMLYSEREPTKGEPSIVDPLITQQIWQDFAPYRAQNH